MNDDDRATRRRALRGQRGGVGDDVARGRCDAAAADDDDADIIDADAA